MMKTKRMKVDENYVGLSFFKGLNPIRTMTV